jgi:hypothetical protein
MNKLDSFFHIMFNNNQHELNNNKKKSNEDDKDNVFKLNKQYLACDRRTDIINNLIDYV